MPGQVRVGLDSHIGHASPTPSPFHQTSYASGSPNVFTNNSATVRIGDVTACGDPAVGASPNVFANNIPVHRLGDATAGHGAGVAIHGGGSLRTGAGAALRRSEGEWRTDQAAPAGACRHP